MDKRFGFKTNCLADIINVLKLQPEVEEALIFGSRAMGTYKNGSDIDIALKGEKITFDTISTIRLRLDELPYLYMYDIIDYKKISNPAVTAHIDELGITFYKKQAMPSEWETYKLSELIQLVGGGTPKTNIPEYWNGEIPWLSVVDFGKGIKKVYQTEKSITEKGLNESSTKILKEGQIIISARGTVGELAVLGRDMAFNQSCYGIYANDKTENNFLYYLLKYSIGKIKKNTHGAVFDTITKQTFDNIEVAIPKSKATQRQIAQILSSLDDKIELNLQMNQTLEAMAQAIFKEWFVHFNFPGFDGELVDGLPKGWRMGRIDELFMLQRGFDLPARTRTEGIYPVVAASGISTYHNEAKVKGPGVTTGRSGVLGNVFYISEDFWPLNTSLFIKEYKMATPLFAYHVLNGVNLIQLNGGSAVPTLNRNDVHGIEHVIPEESVINEYEKIAKGLFEKIFENNKNIESLTQTRDTLLPKLMSGQLEIQA